MAVRTTFANYDPGLQPIPAALDRVFGDIGKLGVLPCSAAGVTTIALTVLATAFAPAITAYAQGLTFGFRAVGASAGAVTVNVGGLGAKNLYHQDGTTWVDSGHLTSGSYYQISYEPSLSGGAGGFYLVNAAAESVLPTLRVNSAPYFASGSVQSTTGTISAASSSLALTSAKDFKNGQGIRINHAGAAFSLNPPTSASATPQGTPGATTYTYTLASLDAFGGVGQSITNFTTTTGNATLDNTNFNRIAWTAPSGGATGIAVYGRTGGSLVLLAVVTNGATQWDDKGFVPVFVVAFPDWIPSAPQTGASLRQWHKTTITSGGGTATLTLAAAAVAAVTAQGAYHDDTAAIQAAIDALPTTGGDISFDVGQYNITASLTLGDGNGTTASTKNGIRLSGNAPSAGLTGITGLPSDAPVGIHSYILAAAAIAVRGPISGVELRDFSLRNEAPTTYNVGLDLLCSLFRRTDNLSVIGYTGVGIYDRITDVHAANGIHTSTYIFVGLYGNTSSMGLKLEGLAASDIYYQKWSQLLVQPSHANNTCIYLGASDDIAFDNVFLQSAGATPAKGVVFDYSVASGNWPIGILFDLLDPYDNTFSNVGTPDSTGRKPQVFITNFQTGNGATVPNLAGLLVVSEDGIHIPSDATWKIFANAVSVFEVDASGAAINVVSELKLAGSSFIKQNTHDITLDGWVIIDDVTGGYARRHYGGSHVFKKEDGSVDYATIGPTGVDVHTGPIRLGASGTLGSAVFGNATSGTITVKPVTGALGTVNVLLPAVDDTLVGQKSVAYQTFRAAAVNFNSANTDTSIAITLPSGFTRYRVVSATISGASASLTTATCGLFTAAAAGGTAIVTSASAITVSTASEGTNNNAQKLTINNPSTMTFTSATLFFRVQTAQGSAATGNVTLVIEPVS